jgi:hypothetical protein
MSGCDVVEVGANPAYPDMVTVVIHRKRNFKTAAQKIIQ